MCSTALTAKRIYCLQIKKIILLCLTWMGMRQTPPLALSLPLSPLKMQRFSLALCLPASISYIFREVQRSSIFCQCRTPIIPHCWVETTHTWLLKYGRGLDMFPFFFSDDSWIYFFFFSFWKPKMERQTKIIFRICAAELIRNSSTVPSDTRCNQVTLELLLRCCAPQPAQIQNIGQR